MNKDTFFSLLDKYLDGIAGPAESKLLEEYYSRMEASESTDLSSTEERDIKEKMYQVIKMVIHRPLVKRMFSWGRIAVAASILLTVGVSSYFLFFNKSSQGHKKFFVKNSPNDILPGRDAATLTLADGRKILLDSTMGTIMDANGVHIINVKGLLLYQGQTSGDEVAFNTITTSRGNQYQLQLDDGTKVWLNAASSLRYPLAFNGSGREVELTGEGYFEVAPDKAKPFKVKTDKQVVEVLGTHFNINSYIDENEIRTTLLEGSVRVSGTHATTSKILTPGEQCILTSDRQLITSSNIDTEKIMGWKNGWFDFDELDLGTIMRQVSRWYDVDIVWAGKLSKERFGGRLSKSVPISVVIEMLEASGVEIKLSEKTLIVKP